MKSVLFILSLLVLGPDPAHAAPVAYDRAMVFSGGGFQTALFLGMLEGAAEVGQSPDVVVGTCGGSIAAAIANALPTDAERKELVESREFFELLRSIEIANPNLLTAVGKLGGMLERRWNVTDRLPDLFSGYLMEVPTRLPLERLNVPFRDSGIRSLIIAARLRFDRQQQGENRAGRRLYQETFFTDPATARLVRGMSSPVAQAFPSSTILPQALVDTTQPMSSAARASISDPYYMMPMEIEGDSYLAGSIDLYPLEVARRLARTVVMTYSAGFDFLEQSAILSVYRYSNNERLDAVTRMSADHWIDISDSPVFFGKYGFNPKPELSSLSILGRVPARYDEYLFRVRKLWEIGRSRAIEGLSGPPNDKTHIRAPRK